MDLPSLPGEYLILFSVIVIAALYGIFTLQVLVSILVIAIACICLFVWRYLRDRPEETVIERSEGEAVLAAGLITLVALAKMEWIVWGIGLAFIFMIHQSLARIEKRLDDYGKTQPPQK